MIKRIISEQQRERLRQERERLQFVRDNWSSPEGVKRRVDLIAHYLKIINWE